MFSSDEDDELHEVLLSIGVPPNLLGYSYIISALELTMQNHMYLHNITKGLYVDIAEQYKVSASSVEKAIRHAIGVAWLYGNIDYIDHIFIHSVRPDKGTPSNSQFLSGLYYYLKRKKVLCS